MEKSFEERFEERTVEKIKVIFTLLNGQLKEYLIINPGATTLDLIYFPIGKTETAIDEIEKLCCLCHSFCSVLTIMPAYELLHTIGWCRNFDDFLLYLPIEVSTRIKAIS